MAYQNPLRAFAFVQDDLRIAHCGGLHVAALNSLVQSAQVGGKGVAPSHSMGHRNPGVLSLPELHPRDEAAAAGGGSAGDQRVGRQGAM